MDSQAIGSINKHKIADDRAILAFRGGISEAPTLEMAGATNIHTHTLHSVVTLRCCNKSFEKRRQQQVPMDVCLYCA